jgi:HTH-type transcriptional regulator/antitoxin HigA
MEPRIIKTEEDHKAALREIEALARHDLQPGSDETNRLEVLGALVESYEKAKFPIELPDPLSAIRFRMEQQGLSAADLVPFLGTRSRVSEVLSGKRPLSLAMIRALHEGLGIPANVLIGSAKEESKEESAPSWAAFPLNQMVKRGWLSASKKELRENPDSVVEPFIRSAFELAATPPIFRKSLHERAQSKSDFPSLLAWTARVLQLTRSVKTERYTKDVLDDAFLTKIARLSASANGPILARELLAFNGVALVFERHLPNTYVDGCSLLLKDGKPVIGMSIRHDRLDNFWFTLLHELVHVSRHLSSDRPGFIDDLDEEASADPIETEADQLASEALIPRSVWRRSRAWRDRTSSAVRELASELGIHPAIIAGRIRRETNRYTLLSNMLGQGEVGSLVGLGD